MIEIEKEGKTVQTATDEALTELNLTEEDADIEIIRKEGLFKTACVRVRKKYTKQEKALDYVQDLIKLMKLNTSAELIDDNIINLKGKDNGIAIGYRGEVLDAIQYLTMLNINKDGTDYKKIVLDAENYREKRKVTLINLAQRLADKALRTGRIVEVEPMNPYERKVFHTALSDNPEVKTESEGQDPNRYIVITPLNDIDDTVNINDFSKRGIGKVKSFGTKKRYF